MIDPAAKLQWAALGVAGLVTLVSGGLAGLAYAGSRRQRRRAKLLRGQAIGRERFGAANIPYTAHISPTVVRTKTGDYVQAFRLAGASFETADDADINLWHRRLNLLWKNLASDEVALWSHIMRRRERADVPGTFPPGFSRDLDTRYRERIGGQTLMVNDLYLAIVYRPQPGAVGATALRWLTRANKATADHELADSLEACEKLSAQLLAALAMYDPEPLAIYERAGQRYSRLLEFFGVLVNGESQPIPLGRTPIDEVLMTTRPFFGAETVEYRMPTATRLGAFLGIKEYATASHAGLYNLLLRADFPFVLTQSFAFLPRASAQQLLSRQFNRMQNARDLAVSQTDDLALALDALSSGEFAMGDHHFSLQVQCEPFDAWHPAGEAQRHKTLMNHVSAARTLLADTGMVVAREDVALEAAYWAQLPGNFAFRTRKAPITTDNWSDMVPLHNYPTGRADGNHWGPAVATLVTLARSAYYFSLHAADPTDPDGGSRKDVGHTRLIGPSGSGKTALMGFLACQLRRFTPAVTQVFMDKDHGLEILIRAEGGTYLPLEAGVPTGMNPLQLEHTQANLEFLRQWLHRLVQSSQPLSVQAEADLDTALREVMKLDAPLRRLTRVLDRLDPTDPEGAHARLSKWCTKENGDYAWVFDNPRDEIAATLKASTLVGFDVTDFLDNPTTRDPVTMYLLHVIQQMLDGRRTVVWLDEFAKLLSDPSLKAFAKNGLRTWRKRNAVAVFATPSPSDVIASDIARTLIEQSPTAIYFPNPDATEADYIDGFGLTLEEYRLVREGMPTGSRQFLVKQGHHSQVCELDLKGFDFELAVLSGRTSHVQTVRRLIDELGPDPEVWLPAYRATLERDAAAATEARAPNRAAA